MEHEAGKIYGTTILCVRKGNEVVIGGDGQVSFGSTILKGTAKKVRTLWDGKVITGFAGSVADAMTLFERLEAKLDTYQGQLLRASIELAKDWRMDKYLRRLEAMIIVADAHNTLILSGSGEVIEPEHDVAAIGSGGNYALSAARALVDIDILSAEDVVRKSMKIAGEICVYTNQNLLIQKIRYP
jgi:ATP-dependent HslUV protease subunit HslV